MGSPSAPCPIGNDPIISFFREIMGAASTSSWVPDSAAAGRFGDEWPQILKAWGFPRTAGRIHAFLLTEGLALNQDELMGALDISRGGASTQLHSLVECGLVERIRILGERQERYRAIRDPEMLFHALRQRHIQMTLRPLWELSDSLVPIASRKDLDWLENIHDLGHHLQTQLTKTIQNT